MAMTLAQEQGPIQKLDDLLAKLTMYTKKLALEQHGEKTSMSSKPDPGKGEMGTNDGKCTTIELLSGGFPAVKEHGCLFAVFLMNQKTSNHVLDALRLRTEAFRDLWLLRKIAEYTPGASQECNSLLPELPDLQLPEDVLNGLEKLNLNTSQQKAVLDCESHGARYVIYTMHPEISNFPFSRFYPSKMIDGPNVLHRDYERKLLFDPMYGPYSFINIQDGTESSGEHDMSLSNAAEVTAVQRLFKESAGTGGNLGVGVVSPDIVVLCYVLPQALPLDSRQHGYVVKQYDKSCTGKRMLL
ncbi:hypothetical protein ACQ4PT_034699 [Festuca glaucescens]